jgi:cell division septation protein DedD
VERGRILAAEILDTKAAAAWKVGGRRLAVAPPVVLPTNPKASVSPVSRTVAVVPKAVVVNKGLAAPTAVVPLATGNRWTVQVATYKNEKFAQQEALGLKAKGYPVFIAKMKDFYLVCIGQFSTQLQADSFLKKNQVKQGGQVRRI